MGPTDPLPGAQEPPKAGVTANVVDIVEALRRGLMPDLIVGHDDNASRAEAESILQRMDRELAVEEALTRQLMARHGI